MPYVFLGLPDFAVLEVIKFMFESIKIYFSNSRNYNLYEPPPPFPNCLKARTFQYWLWYVCQFIVTLPAHRGDGGKNTKKSRPSHNWDTVQYNSQIPSKEMSCLTWPLADSPELDSLGCWELLGILKMSDKLDARLIHARLPPDGQLVAD